MAMVCILPVSVISLSLITGKRLGYVSICLSRQEDEQTIKMAFKQNDVCGPFLL